MGNHLDDATDTGSGKPVELQAQEPGVRRNIDDLPPAAQRALKEAEERRRIQDGGTTPAKEIGGRGGKDPVRYGDWEIDGRAVDF